jgi:hypothetical protein
MICAQSNFWTGRLSYLVNLIRHIVKISIWRISCASVLPSRRPCQLSGEPGFSFQFGSTSTRLPPRLLHFMRKPNDGISTS